MDREGSVGSFGQVGEFQRADRDAFERDDFMSESSKDASDLTILAFAKSDFQIGARLANFFESCLIDLRFAFRQIDSAFESFERIEFDLADHHHRVAFWDFVLGVC